MKKAILTFICIGTITFAIAQKETNNWYFGYSSAINFNSGSPVSLSGGLCNTSEGSASISDKDGNLLFYTDGNTVWNKNNAVMVNGTGLLGNFSSSQSAIIVSWPGSDSLYYIFTVDEETGPDGLRYSIVNTSLQGGLGELTIKNILVKTPTSEKITAVCQPNGIDYWVITHDWGNNNFLAYSITSTGFNNTPVVSSVGTSANGSSTNAIGYLKASPQGDKLAQAIWASNYFELFDFDKTTGIVSHDLKLNSFSGASSGAYGVEFSPDGTKLYGTVITPGYIYQWDVSLATDDEIKASKVLVGTSAVNFNGAVQLASDGKMYLAELSSPWLGVFNFPDLAGVACNFVDQGFQLSTGSNGLGLPNYFPCLFAPNNPSPDPQFTASSPDICQKFCIDYFDASSNDPTSWLWEFEGGSPATSTSQNPTGICYSVPGVFDVKLTATNANGSNTITLTDYITVYATPPFPSISQVGYTLTSSAATAYQWQLNSIDIPGATNQSYIVTQTGFYTVVITDENGCVSSTTLYVLITGIENVFGGNEISISPNPSNGNFTIDFGNENILGEVSINLVNAIGQTIFSTQEFIPSFQKEIQLNNVTDGIYFIEIISNTFSIQKKIIVTR